MIFFTRNKHVHVLKNVALVAPGFGAEQFNTNLDDQNSVTLESTQCTFSRNDCGFSLSPARILPTSISLVGIMQVVCIPNIISVTVIVVGLLVLECPH